MLPVHQRQLQQDMTHKRDLPAFDFCQEWECKRSLKILQIDPMSIMTVNWVKTDNNRPTNWQCLKQSALLLDGTDCANSKIHTFSARYKNDISTALHMADVQLNCVASASLSTSVSVNYMALYKSWIIIIINVHFITSFHNW